MKPRARRIVCATDNPAHGIGMVAGRFGPDLLLPAVLQAVQRPACGGGVRVTAMNFPRLNAT